MNNGTKKTINNLWKLQYNFGSFCWRWITFWIYKEHFLEANVKTLQKIVSSSTFLEEKIVLQYFTFSIIFTYCIRQQAKKSSLYYFCREQKILDERFQNNFSFPHALIDVSVFSCWCAKTITKQNRQCFLLQKKNIGKMVIESKKFRLLLNYFYEKILNER